MLFEPSTTYAQQQLDELSAPQGPPTPPSEVDHHPQSILATGLHVLTTEARALLYLENFYRTDWPAQVAFTESVQLIAQTISNRGKVVVCGVGKSGKIGDKLVATLNSLGLTSVFMHATEAVHGDLGLVKPVRLRLLFLPMLPSKNSDRHSQKNPTRSTT